MNRDTLWLTPDRRDDFEIGPLFPQVDAAIGPVVMVAVILAYIPAALCAWGLA